MDINRKQKTIQLLENNAGEKSSGSKNKKQFLDLTPTAQSLKKEPDKLGIIRIKKLLLCGRPC